ATILRHSGRRDDMAPGDAAGKQKSPRRRRRGLVHTQDVGHVSNVPGPRHVGNVPHVTAVAHSPTYGIRAMKRPRLMASLTARWKAAQLPLRLRLNSLPWLVHSFFRVGTSL